MCYSLCLKKINIVKMPQFINIPIEMHYNMDSSLLQHVATSLIDAKPYSKYCSRQSQAPICSSLFLVHCV